MLIIIILAIIQGVTEFLPVSSSGHLVIVQALFDQEGSIGLEVLLHIGTLFSLLVFFRKDIISIVRSVFEGDWRLALNVVVGSVPVAVGGFLLSNLFDIAGSRQVWVVMFMLSFVAVGMLWLEQQQRKPKHDTSSDLSPAAAFLVGCFQLLALIPGTSRSGITMIGGVLNGLSKTEALRFSFLLGIPAIAGAGLSVFLDFRSSDQSLGLSDTELIGAVLLSAVVGYAAIDLSLRVVERFGFRPFAYYRLALSLVLLVLIVTNVL